jgi:NDP-sugar pyrophosphorylase family protein
MLKIPSPLASQPLPTLALLAGGLATRLGPLTRATPKSLLSVAGQPFLAHQLRLLVSQGVRDIVLCCGHLGEQIETTIGDGSAYNCRIRYSFDNHPAPGVTSPTLLGTGGALHKALPLLGPAFFVLYGDSYLPVALHPIYEAFLNSHKPALMTVFHNNGQWDRSNVLFEPNAEQGAPKTTLVGAGGIRVYDKFNPAPQMHYIDYGLGILSAEAFNPYLCFARTRSDRELDGS